MRPLNIKVCHLERSAECNVSTSDESNKIGEALVKTVVDNLLFIGTVKAVAPIYRTNKLQNFADFKTQSYAYYRTYPYRASQWWLDE